jgi:hypothetical protein
VQLDLGRLSGSVRQPARGDQPSALPEHPN